jgi:putative SOS response-associated peptidase YedK
MCYHKEQRRTTQELAEYYSASYAPELAEAYQPYHHENGFDFNATPLLTTHYPEELKLFNWGLIPFWTKDAAGAAKIRVSTLNCISEEMYEKPAFKDIAKSGQRCLIPATGFFEWRWLNPDDKKSKKFPYYLHLKDQEIFSFAGLYSKWTDKQNGDVRYTYTMLTTRSNPLMDKIHNSKHRMPVILPREFEKDWLNPNLTKDDVLAMCQPLASERMEAFTITKRITDKKVETNVPEVKEKEIYPELVDL